MGTDNKNKRNRLVGFYMLIMKFLANIFSITKLEITDRMMVTHSLAAMVKNTTTLIHMKIFNYINEFNEIILKKIFIESYEICISKLISWKYINIRYYRTLCISLIGTLIISFIVFVFAFLYKDTNSIEGNFNLAYLDYYYYSAVTYFTVGYGDIVPIKGNKIGEILFICECFFSLITNSIFIGVLTYNLM